MNTQTKQEQMYCDIVQLVADIANESFGVDIVHNPLFSGVFKQQLERNHQKLVALIIKYAPVEMPPVSPPIQEEHRQVHKPQPIQDVTPSVLSGNSEQSRLILTR